MALRFFLHSIKFFSKMRQLTVLSFIGEFHFSFQTALTLRHGFQNMWVPECMHIAYTGITGNQERTCRKFWTAIIDHTTIFDLSSFYDHTYTTSFFVRRDFCGEFRASSFSSGLKNGVSSGSSSSISSPSTEWIWGSRKYLLLFTRFFI